MNAIPPAALSIVFGGVKPQHSPLTRTVGGPNNPMYEPASSTPY